METRVRFIIVGVFSLAVTVATFLFVFWIHTGGGMTQRRNVMIQFMGSASGLRPGSAVLFNGVRVGEVTSVSFDAANSERVNALISVDRQTPLRSDTRVGVEGQGLMGTTAVALYGRSSDAPLLSQSPQELPVLGSNTSGTSVTEEARQVMKQISTVISENAEPIKDTINNVDKFAAALARNSDRVDNIVAGIEKMTGGGPKPLAPQVYDLPAPSDFPPGDTEAPGQIVVGEVSGTVVFDTQRLLRKAETDGRFILGDAQWTDSLPKLVQKKVIETFENAHYIKSVSRPIDQGSPDYQLLIDIRDFQINETDHKAVVELSVRLIGQNGRVVDARIVRGEAPASILDGKEAVSALANAFAAAARDLVGWIGQIKVK
jgi:phospholipid/cholesterol/gamma-HCH transport system substrate-binding protein